MAVRGVGRCPMVFLLALALDVVGLTVLFIGVFADVRMAGRALGDCLIYSGAIGIFLSLVAWLFWFTGNIQVSLEQLEKDALATRTKLARRFSDGGHQLPPAKVVGLGLGELSTTINWELSKQLLQIPRDAEKQPRFVELRSVKGLDHLRSVLQQNGDRAL
ncbi:transmembrane protein 238-like [Callorhinchus milii]|uniref:transmembrane protein 238-like n=1 Tax=Callorhinchus milii TaxID=7868 RepID=UPI0004572B33|nr:transmembrane protein 238-like [Callorhinchus milii]|eukprot:gi/632943657/ref/XP_007887066.1/ PREDICTED: transmembrane protein 238-like [Callorhinchus milii]